MDVLQWITHLPVPALNRCRVPYQPDDRTANEICQLTRHGGRDWNGKQYTGSKNDQENSYDSRRVDGCLIHDLKNTDRVKLERS